MNVFVPGMSGESLALFDELRRAPARAEGLTFVGVHFPGINRADYLSLHPTVRQRGYFMMSTLRAAIAARRADLMPFDYPGIVRDLEQNVRIDVAVAQVSPPNCEGRCSLGASYDFLPSVWRKAAYRIAHVNPRLPRTHGSFDVNLADCHFVFESETEIPGIVRETPDAATLDHAALAASLVDDGSTVQLGVGRLQTALLTSLKSHRNLRICSGMISSSIFELLETGAVDENSLIECGVALGDADFYGRLDSDRRFFFRPARETHDILRIAAIANFCAVNSAVEVDLFGQINAECVDGRLIAGVGGLPAFSHGARLSPGGRSIILLPAAAEGGSRSRIVASLSGATLTALPRYEADFVVTEYGIARLRDKSVYERASALIEIAAPQFREELERAWRESSKRL